MRTRRLNPETDLELYREAFTWLQDAPRWFQEADKVFRPRFTFEDLLEQTDYNVEIGVWDEEEFIGMIPLTLHGKGFYEAHLWAKRGASLETLTDAAYQIKCMLFKMGATEIFVWLPEKNSAVRKLCAIIGLLPDGIDQIKGTYHGRLIKWLRLSCKREQAELRQAA